jgi:hypothetical protein
VLFPITRRSDLQQQQPPSSSGGNTLYSSRAYFDMLIRGHSLPSTVNSLLSLDHEESAAALGNVAQLVLKMSKILDIPLRYRFLFSGVTSRQWMCEDAAYSHSLHVQLSRVVSKLARYHLWQQVLAQQSYLYTSSAQQTGGSSPPFGSALSSSSSSSSSQLASSSFVVGSSSPSLSLVGSSNSTSGSVGSGNISSSGSGSSLGSSALTSVVSGSSSSSPATVQQQQQQQQQQQAYWSLGSSPMFYPLFRLNSSGNSDKDERLFMISVELLARNVEQLGRCVCGNEVWEKFRAPSLHLLENLEVIFNFLIPK